MDTNVGTVGHVTRTAGFFIIAICYLMYQHAGIMSTTAGILVAYLFMTAPTKYCLIWDILGISILKWKPVRKW